MRTLIRFKSLFKTNIGFNMNFFDVFLLSAATGLCLWLYLQTEHDGVMFREMIFLVFIMPVVFTCLRLIIYYITVSTELPQPLAKYYL